MQITKSEFETLWAIEHLGCDDPARLSDGTPASLKQATREFLRLEELGLIQVEVREKNIYSAMPTAAGRNLLSDKGKYAKWISELEEEY